MVKKSLSALFLGTVLLVAAPIAASASGIAPGGSDGLANYNGDYTDAAVLVRPVRTTYQVGKGAAAAAIVEGKGTVAIPASSSIARIDGGLDGLSNYSGDYTDAAVRVRPVRTTYRVGVGGAAHLQTTVGSLAKVAAPGERG